MSKKPILITGHTGFLGTAIRRQFERSGIRWVGASRANGFDLSRSDALDAVEPARCVVHMAARVAVMDSWTRPADFHRINFCTTLTALDFARRCNAPFVYLSSYMYGVAKTEKIDEDHPIDMRNPYAWSKREGEILAESYARMFGIPVIVLRLFNVFGPGQGAHQLMPSVLTQALNGDEIEVDDVDVVRDWLWSGDFADAIAAVVDRPPPGFSTFNLGTSVATSVGDLVDAAMAILGPRRVISRAEGRPNEIPSAVCDNCRFVETFGWRPQTTIMDGMKALIADMQRQCENG